LGRPGDNGSGRIEQWVDWAAALDAWGGRDAAERPITAARVFVAASGARG